jgi:hypothetical protein
MKRYRWTGLLVLLGSFLFIAGCSGTRATKATKRMEYRERIGKVTEFDFRDKTLEILQNRYQYVYEFTRYDQNQLYVETLWRERNPFEDEAEAGVINARTKIIVTARPMEFSTGALWIATIQFINQVQLEGGTQWIRMPLTKQAMAYFRKITDDLRTEYQTGIRRY